MISSGSQAQDAEHDKGDDVLRSFREWLVQEARVGKLAPQPDQNKSADDSAHPARKEPYLSPIVAPIEPSTDVNFQQASFQSAKISRNRRSVGRRVFRTLVCGVIIGAIAGAVFAWQSSGDDQTKDLVRAWGHWSLSRLSSVLGTKSSPGLEGAAQAVSKPPDQAPTPDSAPSQAAAIVQPPSMPIAAGPSPELQHQLDAMASDLIAVRRIVEQLAAKQEQMAQDIATLRSGEHSAGQTPLSPRQSAAIGSPLRKNVPRAMHSEAVVQPAIVPVPVPAPSPRN